MVPVWLTPLVFWRDARSKGASAIFADCADGSSQRIGMSRHASVRDALERVVSAIEQGVPLPDHIDN